ncbi:Ftr1 protein [Hymenopellis radicata]|nr:Ftr1 protein [Hymenopellis radicata]
MAKQLFSVPIFFIVFRETLEAAIIISVLLGLAEQIVQEDHPSHQSTAVEETPKEGEEGAVASTSAHELEQDDSASVARKRLVRKLRIQIFAGAGTGLLIAFAIGATFIAIWFTKASNLWKKSEELWEGIFELIAALMIFVMGVTMLKMDRAKAKWRIKLQRAFDGSHRRGDLTGKWALFLLPFITVLREGLEAVVFVGGVSLGQAATSIPIAAIVGIVAGLICGFLVYEFASRTTLTIFLIVMTNLLLLIGAGLFSRAVRSFEQHAFNVLLGTDADEAVGKNGPGTYRVQGNVWHLDCCNPYDNLSGQGWTIFNAILGWSNNGSLGTILSYVFYWIALIVVLVYMKWKEGRVKLFGYESAAGIRRRARRETGSATQEQNVDKKEGHSNGGGVASSART